MYLHFRMPTSSFLRRPTDRCYFVIALFCVLADRAIGEVTGSRGYPYPTSSISTVKCRSELQTDVQAGLVFRYRPIVRAVPSAGITAGAVVPHIPTIPLRSSGVFYTTQPESEDGCPIAKISQLAIRMLSTRVQRWREIRQIVPGPRPIFMFCRGTP